MWPPESAGWKYKPNKKNTHTYIESYDEWHLYYEISYHVSSNVLKIKKECKKMSRQRSKNDTILEHVT